MCGVAAAVGVGHEDLVRRMVASLAHRGVRSAVRSGRGWSVGHVRLPIVGVGEGNDQPVDRGPWTLAWVGEVLDFRDRRPGAECDTDLVADGWANRGPESFRDFDGFWSVVAADGASRSVSGLVDYLGQKPLYVRRDDPRWAAVASEPDAVAALAPVRLDAGYLGAVARWGYCPDGRRTPYEGVDRVLPGEQFRLSAGTPPWYRVADRLDPSPLTPDQLREEVELAVRRRVLSSDVPVACLVSGGLDSSVTYTLARRHGDVRAFHAENGESDACRRVAPGADPLPLDAVDLPTALAYHQEPVDLGSLVPQAALSDAVGRAGYRVCLTGDGADELFGGYGRALRYDSQASDVWQELAGWHLPRLDRVMMRNRVEVRSPFLARRVAAAALALPWPLRRDKRILRDLFRDDLPLGAADEPKRPLRTAAVEGGGEAYRLELIREFVRRVRPWLQDDDPATPSWSG